MSVTSPAQTATPSAARPRPQPGSRSWSRWSRSCGWSSWSTRSDSYGSTSDGICARTTSTGSGAIFTAPFLHASWSHLIGNTIPFVFMGAIIALEGARRLAAGDR